MFWYPLGAFFIGVIVSKAGSRLLDNAFKAHREGAEIGYYALGASSDDDLEAVNSRKER